MATLATPYQRLRLAQVQVTSFLMRKLVSRRCVESLVARARHWAVARQVFNRLANYNRVFPDLTTAKCAVSRYTHRGHDSPENIKILNRLVANTRPSDYPVLYHLSRLSLDGLRVFDLGGTTGGTFHLYDRHLAFPTNFRWTVGDLPATIKQGRALAHEKNESRLQFSSSNEDASGHDVLLISGTLHYLEDELCDYVARLSSLPRHIFINRTPLVNASNAATVQYVDGVMVACRLLNRNDLITGMQRIGYRLEDQWQVLEFSIPLPFNPEYWVREYSGLYFKSEL